MAEIWAFIAEDFPENATRFLLLLEESFLSLLDQRLLVPAREELAPGLRAQFVRNYKIYYVPTDREIIIVRVVHGGRDQAALFTEE